MGHKDPGEIQRRQIGKVNAGLKPYQGRQGRQSPIPDITELKTKVTSETKPKPIFQGQLTEPITGLGQVNR